MDISFTCDCGERIDTVVGVPEPNFSAEKNKDSGSEYWEDIFCENCEKENEIYIVNTFYAADCYVNDGDTEVTFGIPYYDSDEQDELDWYIGSKSQFDVFNEHIKSVE
ncbi:hypothetical protein L4C31_16770, partial [Aliivibrio sifiae]